MSQVSACQYGRSGYYDERLPPSSHRHCAHHPGGAHHGGLETPVTYLLAGPPDTRRGLVVTDQHGAVQVWEVWHGEIRGHVWTCSCPCHAEAALYVPTLWTTPVETVEPVQLDLFAELVPV